jgi:hypothetical protein
MANSNDLAAEAHHPVDHRWDMRDVGLAKPGRTAKFVTEFAVV